MEMLKTDTSIGNERGTEAEQSPREPETDMRTQARDRSPTRLLILTEGPSDLTKILESCGAAVTLMSPKEAVGKDLAEYEICHRCGGRTALGRIDCLGELPDQQEGG